MAKYMVYLSTTTDATLESPNRTARYVVPILRTANFDPARLLSMITALQRVGIVNTKHMHSTVRGRLAIQMAS
jgi:hypothetical protein